jgi:arabinogalactan oligomer / maltooligosaccharide transport system substrate-binding protein
MRSKFLALAMLLVMVIGVSSVVMAQDTRLVIWADDTRAPALQSLVDDFESEYGISLVIQELDFGDIRDNFRVAGPAGEGPDIITGASDWLGELVADGLLAPIDLSAREGDFLQGALQLFNYNGVQYGMPYAVENVAFVRNPELVPDAPTTWDEVAAISRQLVDDGVASYGFIESMNDPYHFFAVQSAFGGYVFGVDDGVYDVADVGIDSPGAIDSGLWLADLVEGGYMPADVDYDIKHTLFEAGDAAMIVTGPWALPRIRTAGVAYEVSGLPAGPAGPSTPFLGGQGFMISAFSDNPVLAEAFLLEFVATEEVMMAIFEADPRPSAFIAVNDAIEDEDVAGFAAAGSEGIAMPNIPAMASVWTAWGDATEFIIRQTLSPEEAYATAADQIRTLIGDTAAAVDTTTMTVVEVAQSADNFSTLVAAIEAAGLVDALSAEGPFTLLAPDNAAFAALLAELEMEAEDLLADTDLLTEVLTYHVIEGEFFAADIADVDAVTTLNGAEIGVSLSEFGVILLNETVEVSQVNIVTSNGVIHIIDGVLLPPGS